MHAVDEEQGFVSVYDPHVFGDATTRKFELDSIIGVTVTGMDYVVQQ